MIVKDEGFLSTGKSPWARLFYYQLDLENEFINLFGPKDPWGTPAKLILTKEQLEKMLRMFKTDDRADIKS